MRAWQKIWIAFLVLNVIVIGLFWWNGSGAQVLSGNHGLILVALGSLAGFAATLAVLIQFFVMSRLPWLERVFGLDKLAIFHQLNGRLALPLLLLHPLLIVLGYGSMTNSAFRDQMSTLIESNATVLFAAIGLGGFVLVAATSLYFARNKFRYESWYFVHLIAYIAIFFSFWHQIELGSNLLVSQAFYYYWIALYTVTFAAVIIFRVGRPIYSSFRHRFTVEKLVRENDSVVSVYITGKDLERFKVEAGQFMIFRFLQAGFWWQAHPFSLSIAPNGKELRITVKAVGDFTEKINQIKPGTKVIVDGPHGVFTDKFSNSDKVLMLAGGIGITPIRSLSEEMAAKDKDVVLLYGSKIASEFSLRDELEEIASRGNVKLTYIASEEPDFKGETGFVDEEKILRLVPDFRERDVFMCGPAPMMNALLSTLKNLNVSKDRIHYERFSLH